MINIALVDDDVNALNLLEGIVKKYFEDKKIDYKISSFLSSETFYSIISDTFFDLLILDIDMPKINGIEIAKKAKEAHYNSTIMFFSQREDLVFDCFSVHPFAFIRKNKLIEDFYKSVDLYIKSVYEADDSKETISIKTKKEIKTIKISDIIYIEGNRNYQTVYTKNNEKIEVRVLLNTLDEKLSNKGFLRVHKGYLVNSLFIKRIENSEVVLSTNERIPLSRNRKDEILEEYLDLTKERTIFFD